MNLIKIFEYRLWESNFTFCNFFAWIKQKNLHSQNTIYYILTRNLVIFNVHS